MTVSYHGRNIFYTKLKQQQQQVFTKKKNNGKNRFYVYKIFRSINKVRRQTRREFIILQIITRNVKIILRKFHVLYSSKSTYKLNLSIINGILTILI